MGAPSRTAVLEWLAKRLGPFRLDPVGFVRNILEMEPHPGQRLWLVRAYKPENAITTGNRWGKSTIAAAKRIYKATYRLGWTPEIAAAQAKKHELYRSVNVGPTADQSRIVWLKAFGLLQNKRASWLVKSVKLTPFPCIELITGATIEARSTARDGQYLLGHSFDDINWDEAALERKFEKIRDNVLRMRLVDRSGILDYTTTGQGRNEYGRYFLRGLEGKEPILYAQSGSSYDNPYIPRADLERNAARMSAARRQQNIDGAITDGDGDFFDTEDLEIARTPLPGEIDLDDAYRVIAVDDDDIVAWAKLFPNPEARDQEWRLRFPSHRYLHAWDLADKQDWAVGSTWDLSMPRATLVEFERFHQKGWGRVKARIRDRQSRYGGKSFLDLTGVGDAVGEDLQDIGAEGIVFTGGLKGTKHAMLEHYKMLLNLRQVRWPDIGPWVGEHSWYAKDDAGLVKDCVMSGAIAGWFMRRAVISNAPASAYR
ncbi:MAG: hypothetical protein ABSD03_11035 [Vulcanimicrobiaceae bacterium]